VKRKLHPIILFAIAGTGACLILLFRFLLLIVNNRLPWAPSDGIRQHYVAVGNSFSQGFSVGFFLCFFLSLASVGLADWLRGARLATAPLRPLHGRER